MQGTEVKEQCARNGMQRAMYREQCTGKKSSESIMQGT